MVKNLPANTRDAGLIPRLGDPREGNGIVVYICQSQTPDLSVSPMLPLW